MSPKVSEQDLVEIRQVIETEPGAKLTRVKIRSRHSHARVREAVRELERRGDVIIVTDDVEQYVWPSAAADEAMAMLAHDGYHRLSFPAE